MRKTLLLLEIAICYSYPLAFLTLGIIFFPMQLAIAVIDPSYETAIIPTLTAAGFGAAIGLYQLLNWIIFSIPGSLRPGAVSVLLLLGLMALIPFAFLFEEEFRIPGALAFFATFHIAYIGRDYRRAKQ